MSIKEINASSFQKAFISAAVALDSNKEWINELNVFPVPDGDTGTNMTLTITAAARDVSMLENPDMKTLCKTISTASLRGARGNSGVILSQLLRGLCKEFAEYESINQIVITSAFSKAVDTAYKAVMKPKEGTILTVARSMSDAALKYLNEIDDLEQFIALIIEEGDKSLANTPELLPVLKQAGVVDSGGQGLIVAFKGAFESLLGKEVVFKNLHAPERTDLSSFPAHTEHIKFGYCTEFIIKTGLNDAQELEFKHFLESMGDSIVCVADDDLTKIHVHTNDPGAVISKALLHGELTRLKIDNMREEHNERYNQSDDNVIARTVSRTAKANDNIREYKEYGFITVCCGEGLTEFADSLGCDRVISGGQTMNPSTDDILKAISDIDARNIFVFPNNGNIIMAASQAAELTEDKNVIVIHSKNFPQFIAGMMAFDEDADVDTNASNIKDALKSVQSAEITYSIRDTMINNISISEGDFMFISDNGIAASGKAIDQTIVEGLSSMVNDNTELITLYYGSDVNETSADDMMKSIQSRYPDVEVSVYYGGQPVYYYLISVE